MFQDQRRNPTTISMEQQDVIRLQTHSIPLLLIGIGFRPQFLDVQEQPYSVPYLVDAHLLEHSLVHLQQVLSIDVVLSKKNKKLVIVALEGTKINEMMRFKKASKISLAARIFR